MNLKTNLKSVGIALCSLCLLVVLFSPGRTTRELAQRKYPNRIPVTFWHMWSAEWKDVVDKIVDRYNRSQDKYEVIALSVPGTSADTKFLLGTIGGDPPDVMAQWNQVIPTWADNDMLTPFDEVMTSEEKARYTKEAYPVVQRIGAYKGKTYGIPIGINLSAIYYLPNDFRQAGLDPDHFPKTLELLSAAGERLNRRDRNGNLTRVGFFPGLWQEMAPLFGGGFYDFGREHVSLDTRANLRAIEFLAASRKRLGYDQVVRFQAGLDSQSFSGGWPFIGGAYSAVVDGQWRVEQLAKYAPKLEYRTALIPAPSGGVVGGGFCNGNFMVLPKTARHKRGAWDFIKFWSGIDKPERAAEFYTMGGWLPLSPRIADSPIYRAYIKKFPQFKTFVDGIGSKNLQVPPPVPYQVFLDDLVKKEQDLALRGDISPTDAVRSLVDGVANELHRRKELGNHD